jgi:hypothetical protein
MKLTCHGWSRDCGSWTLMEKGLYEAHPCETIRQGEVAVRKNHNGGIDVWWGSKDVRLQGDYFFEMELTPKDILRLFVDAFSELDPEKIEDFMRAARERGKQTKG